MTHKVLVIGVGHSDRGEDVVGLLVAQRVRRGCGDRADVRESSGTPVELLAQWEDADDVIVVDATPGDRPGVVHRYEASGQSVPTTLLDGAAVPDLQPCVQQAQRDGRLPRRLRIYAIEAGEFRREAGVSPEIAAAARDVASQILDEVNSNGRRSPAPV